MRDVLFAKERTKQFEFDESVASVFDDMLRRSIPFYEEQVGLIVDFARLYLKEGSVLYDLGSSTGNVLFKLAKVLDFPCSLYGLDNSRPMIEQARLKAKAYEARVEFLEENFLDFELLPSRVVIANYTMQFVRPMQREKIIQKIFDSLEHGGIFLMGEKMMSADKSLDKSMIDRYHLYKSNQGYSQTEIAQKREALENVLVPYTQEENFAMLYHAGFKQVELLFKWVNFALMVAIKE